MLQTYIGSSRKSSINDDSFQAVPNHSFLFIDLNDLLHSQRAILHTALKIISEKA